MSMLEYVKSLVPSFGQDKIIDDLARQRKEVEEVLLPSLAQAEKAFKNHKFKSSAAKGIEKTLKGRFRDHRSEDLFGILHDIFKDAPEKISELEKIVSESFAKDVTKEALTYRKASVLKFIETLSFAIQYTIRATLRVIAAEADAESGDAEDAHLTAAQKAFLEEKYVTWLDALTLLDESAKSIATQLSSIPEVTISEDASQVEAVAGAARLDPLRLNFISPSINPFYHIRSYMAEADVRDIHRAREEKKLVELRLYDLKARRDGKPEAQVQASIEKTENRLKQIDFKIAKLAHVG